MRDDVVPPWIPKVFYAGAILNWAMTIGTIVDPVGSAVMLGVEPPNQPFALRAWAGMAFLFGFMFYEIARDPVGKMAMIRYAWLEKLVSAASVTIGFFWGNAPLILFVLICVADWAWIPPFIHAGRVLRTRVHEVDAASALGRQRA